MLDAFVVSLPVLKDHNLAGVSLGMKNFFGAIHNPNKYHDNHCDPFVAEVFDVPLVRQKHRLTVIDALRGLNAPALSPDGKRVAYAAEDNGAGEIWVQDLAGGTRTRLTFTPADESQPDRIGGREGHGEAGLQDQCHAAGGPHVERELPARDGARA